MLTYYSHWLSFVHYYRWCDFSTVWEGPFQWGQIAGICKLPALSVQGWYIPVSESQFLHWSVELLQEVTTPLTWTSWSGAGLLHQQRSGDVQHVWGDSCYSKAHLWSSESLWGGDTSASYKRANQLLCLSTEPLPGTLRRGKKKRETEENSKKRKYVEEDLKELKQKKKSIREICISLENDADRMAVQVVVKWPHWSQNPILWGDELKINIKN